MTLLEKIIVEMILPNVDGKVTVSKLRKLTNRNGLIVGAFQADELLAWYSNFHRKHGRMATEAETRSAGMWN